MTGGAKSEGAFLVGCVVVELMSLLTGTYLAFLRMRGGRSAGWSGSAVKYWLMTLVCLYQLLRVPLASLLMTLCTAGRSLITPGGALPAD